MKNYHTEFKFNLFVLGPVHIGSGKKYTKKEYIYENEKYYFPDMGELYLKIRNNEKLSKEFIEFMSEKNTGYRTTPLKEFLSKNNINDRDFGGYSIAESGYEFEKNRGAETGIMLETIRHAISMKSLLLSKMSLEILTFREVH